MKREFREREVMHRVIKNRMHNDLLVILFRAAPTPSAKLVHACKCFTTAPVVLPGLSDLITKSDREPSAFSRGAHVRALPPFCSRVSRDVNCI